MNSYFPYPSFGKRARAVPAARTPAFLALFFLPFIVFAQQRSSAPEKFALVIGNGHYTNITRLNNPVNDADDMALALRGLGFAVEKITNASRVRMEEAAEMLRLRLSANPESYGFFYYAGHAVESDGVNYLIPADAEIPSERYLRDRAVPMQALLGDLNTAGNILNVVVLDACRDNPFPWRRGTGRGLAVEVNQPRGSIIVFATSAGSSAADGEGRNGLFTGQLLSHLTTPGIEVNEVFRLTMADVARLSDNRQYPAVYNQFPGRAWLGEPPDTAVAEVIRPLSPPAPERNARLWSLGVSAGTSFADPWFQGTARGTLSPFNHVFAELGIDFGLVTKAADTEFYSLTPFAHAAYYLPFSDWGAWYAGAGGAYAMARYSFPEGDVPLDSFVLDAFTGLIFFDTPDISYTLRTKFDHAGHKVSVGYIYRFK